MLSIFALFRIANEEDFRKIMEKVPEYRIKPEKVKQFGVPYLHDLGAMIFHKIIFCVPQNIMKYKSYILTLISLYKYNIRN